MWSEDVSVKDILNPTTSNTLATDSVDADIPSTIVEIGVGFPVDIGDCLDICEIGTELLGVFDVPARSDTVSVAVLAITL